MTTNRCHEDIGDRPAGFATLEHFHLKRPGSGELPLTRVRAFPGAQTLVAKRLATVYAHPRIGTEMHNSCAVAPQLRSSVRLFVLSFAFILLSAPTPMVAQQSGKKSSTGLEPIHSYISSGWNTLSRSLSDCATFSDPKLTGALNSTFPRTSRNGSDEAARAGVKSR